MTDLFVDDGQSTRPNRQNIINASYNKVGIGSCYDEYFGGQKTVVVYAQNYIIN
jgi:hypothetical protein